MNNVSIVGRLTNAVDPKFQESGKVIANFSIAVNDGKDSASFFNCTAFDKVAEVLINHTQKGSQVALNGRLKQERWVSQDGSNRSAVKIIVGQVTLLGSKGDKPADAEPNFDNEPF